MDIRELYNIIKDQPREETFKLFYALLKDGVLSFTDLINVYVAYLNDEKELAKGMKAEASVSIMSLLLDPKDLKGLPDFEEDRKNRALYFLEKSGTLDSSELARKLNYDPEKGRKSSHYHWGEEASDYGR